MSTFVPSVTNTQKTEARITTENNVYSDYIDNIRNVYLEDSELVNAYEYDSKKDNATYLVKVFENKIEIYNDDNLVASGSCNTYADIQLDEKIDELERIEMTSGDYDSWSPWYFYKKDNLHINDIESLTLSLIMGLVEAWVGVPFSGAYSIAILMYNRKYADMFANIYISINSYCTILIKERYDFYVSSTNAYIRSDELSPQWWGSPWDYTQPAACRALADIY